ncbi:MAG TPA: hypothetical protein PKC28_14945 [Bdellovibrionales bacterium]|nr:hypothetical protein [Bdellovibrionales bacterium]
MDPKSPADLTKDSDDAQGALLRFARFVQDQSGKRPAPKKRAPKAARKNPYLTGPERLQSELERGQLLNIRV